MKAKNLFLLFAGSLLLNVSCVTSSQSGELIKETRQVGNFNRLEISSAFEVHFTQSDTYRLAIEADSAALSKIKTKTNDDNLIIEREDRTLSIKKNSDYAKVYISAPSLNDIELSGATVFYADSLKSDHSLDMEVSGASKIEIGHLQADNLKMEVSGASSIKTGIDVSSNVAVEISGASNVKLSGKCNKISAEVSGASNIDIKELQYTNITKDISGASSISK